MLIDTHCHLDAAAFDADRQAVVARARAAGVGLIVIPAVGPENFARVQTLAQRWPETRYALGLHPLIAPRAGAADLQILRVALRAALDDPRFVGIGEIGLDHFVPALSTPAMRAHQEVLFQAQLALAAEHDLPVILHVRRSQDRILKNLRRHPGLRGIAHAFNGSLQQAQQFVDLGYALGAGGAMTFERARRIRRLAQAVALEHWVLETDAPDIAPAWRHPVDGQAPRNEPCEVAGIAAVLAQCQGVAVQAVIAATARNAFRVLPRLTRRA